MLGVVGLRLSWFRRVISYCYGARSGRSPWGGRVNVTVLVLVGGAPGGETPRVADSSAAGAGRFFHNSVPPSFGPDICALLVC